MKNLTGFLDHLLQSAGATVTGANQTNRGGGVGGAINSDFGRGTLAGGALGLLAGKNKKLRKLAQYGGLAALGVMVYNTYAEYQRQQGGFASGQAGQAASPSAPAQAAPTAALPAPATVDRVDAAQAEVHGRAILKALVAAAKADGHIDARERAMIEGEYARLGLGADVAGWLAAELQRPLDPAEVARAAATPEMAAEMYLASLLVADEQSFMEKAYLDELARQLRLPPDLQSRLQRQLQPAAAWAGAAP